MKKIAFVIFFLVLMVWGFSCKSSGNFRLFLTDQPVADALAIRVQISEITAHKTGQGYERISGTPATYDLLQLMNREQEIANIELAQGSYTEIRLIVDSGEIAFASGTYALTVPSSEVKVPVQFDVSSGGATRVVLDFDARNSIEVTNPGHSGGYILRPVIHVKSVSF